MSEARATRIFLAHRGRCGICTNVIRDGEKWDADHIKALWDGGTDTDANLHPVHVKCHQGKTATEAGQRARRNKAITASFAGKSKPGRKLGNPKFKTKIGGGIVWRDTGKPVTRTSFR
jgi:5-methylcytosine-specific restriction endonuclease McrA